MELCIVTKAFNMGEAGRIEPGTRVELTDSDFVRFHGLGCVKTVAELEAEQAAQREIAKIEAESEEAAAAARTAAIEKATSKVAETQRRAEARAAEKAREEAEETERSRVVGPQADENEDDEDDLYPVDLSDLNVADAKPLIEGATDIEMLRDWSEAELSESQPRKTLLEALDLRISELENPAG